MVIVIIYLEEMCKIYIVKQYVNVFDDSIASGLGNLQVVKKAVVTEGKLKDYGDEINSKLVYFAKSDVSCGVALRGDRGPFRARGLKGPVIKDPLEVEVQLKSLAFKGPKVLLERLVKWELLEAEV